MGDSKENYLWDLGSEDLQHLTDDNNYSLDSDDDFCSVCQNVSHRYQTIKPTLLQ